MPNVFHAKPSSNSLYESLNGITHFSQTRLHYNEQAFRGLLFSESTRSARSGHSSSISFSSISTDKQGLILRIDRDGSIPWLRPCSVVFGRRTISAVSRGTHGRRSLKSFGARFCLQGCRIDWLNWVTGLCPTSMVAEQF